MSRRIFLLACGWGLLVTARGATLPLAPPPDPALPVKPLVMAPAAASTGHPAVAPPGASGSPNAKASPGCSIPFHHDEADIPDSIGAVNVRPVPEPDEDAPAFVQQAAYLLAHHDSLGAVAYLRKVAVSPQLSERDRARVILQLADSLHATNQPAEELCWLKIWRQLYPTRPETGAVAYRTGVLYTQMGLADLARDSFYLALSSAVNHGQVEDAGDLAQYTRLTTGTLWMLAQNEYRAGNWERAAELYDRFRHEAPATDVPSQARAEFLQADCYYQLRQSDKAKAAYQQALQDHPFHPLAPSARLRLYHLDMVAGHPEQAQGELEALVWTVRTVWPKDEALWQQRAADLLLALNRNDGTVLPPLLKKAVSLGARDKAWQADLGHYDRLASLEATNPHSGTTPPATAPAGAGEQDELAAMQQSIDALAPPKISAPNPQVFPQP